MNKIIISLLLILSAFSSEGQNIGIGTNTPDASAKLEVSSTNSGFLPPRMSTTERDAIASPAVGLQIYNTSSHCLEIFDFGRWNAVYCVPVDSSTLMTDIDGHRYPTIKICDQTWIAKNLDVSRYRNGDIIPQVSDPTQWANLTTGAWCWYNNDSATYAAVYGKLYNWYAVNDARGLAPAGWHIPSDGEWTVLKDCLGGAVIAGGKMKEMGTTHWNNPNIGATNSSEFNGLPAGGRYESAEFVDYRTGANFWSSTEYSSSFATYQYLSNVNTSLNSYNYSKGRALSIRCVKDTPITTLSNGLVAYYPFTGNAGDSSGNGNHGTANGPTLTSDRFGNANSAYYFSSSGCATRINANINTSSIQTGLTVSFWVFRSGNGCLSPRIMEFYPGNSGASICVFAIGNGAQFLGMTHNLQNNSVVGLTCNQTIDNIWSHIVYANDGSIAKIYQNGILVNTQTCSSNPIISGNVAFGRMNHPSYDAFNGSLDDIRIYNRALTQAEITYLATH